MILYRVYEMKKEIQYYLNTSQLSKISNKYSEQMERSLLRYKVRIFFSETNNAYI